MKLTILQQDLLPPLQAVARSAGIKSTLPVLGNILLETDNGKLKLSATNLELGVIKQVNAEVIEDGQITVPSRTFVEVISSLTGNKIEIEASLEQLQIKAGNFSATLNCIPATEFPTIPLASQSTISLSGRALVKALPEVAFAAAAEDGRPILTGILTEIKQNSLELVATDGFRLAHKVSVLENSENTSFKALIPRKTFEEVVKIINEDLGSAEAEEDKIEIAISENQNQIIFKIGQTQVSSRLIEGQFPAWEKIIPTQKVARATMNRPDFLKAVKLASVFARGEAANIIKLQTQKGKIKLLSEARELGGQETEIEGDVEGEELIIAFNSKFLIDALQGSATAEVSLEFSGNLSPLLIKPVGEEGLEYVVMPVRIN